MPDIQISTPSVASPTSILSLEDLKTHLRIDGTGFDIDLKGCIADAVAYCDGGLGVLNRTILPCTWALYLPEFPDNGIIELPYPPIVSVLSVQYLDTAGATQTLSSSNYIFRKKVSAPGEIEKLPSVSWPSTLEHPRAVTVTYTAGYGPNYETPVPPKLRRLVRLFAGHYFKNREATTQGSQRETRKLVFGADDLIRELHVPHSYGD